jgi:hypothetical protein
MKMKNRITGKSYRSAGFLLTAMLAACAAAGRHTATGDPALRAILEQEIRAKLERSVVPVVWNASRMEISARASDAVPGLVYHYGTYSVPEVSHGFAFAVAGSWGDRRSILKTATDWAVLVSGWNPANDLGVLRACSELIETVGTDPDPRFPPVVIIDSLSVQTHRVPPGLRTFLPGMSARVQSQGNRAHASIWALEPGIRRRYTCAFAWDSLRLEAHLAVTDSSPGEGLLPRGP